MEQKKRLYRLTAEAYIEMHEAGERVNPRMLEQAQKLIQRWKGGVYPSKREAFRK